MALKHTVVIINWNLTNQSTVVNINWNPTIQIMPYMGNAAKAQGKYLLGITQWSYPHLIFQIKASIVKNFNRVIIIVVIFFLFLFFIGQW